MTQTSTARQVKRFGLVGILNTLIDYTIFISLTKIFSIPLDRVWTAKFVSGSVAVINSFFFNKTWVFKSRQKVIHQFFKFIISTFVAVFVIQLGLVQFFSSNFPEIGKLLFQIATQLGLTGLLPQIITEAFVIKTVAFGLATAASMTWNFLLYKFVVFK